MAGEVEDRLEEVDFPLEYSAELLGEYKETEQAQNRLRGFALITAVGIFVLLLVVFKRFRLAVLTFVTLPTALVGGAVAVYWFGGIISLGSLVGFFTVLGIVARNGIMLISHYQHLEDEEGVPFGPALVIQGAKERLAPILMTALTTGLALVPLLLAGNIAGQEIEYPMAIVIMGGLICSTLLNLFVVPSLYLFLGKSRKEKAALGLVVISPGQPPSPSWSIASLSPSTTTTWYASSSRTSTVAPSGLVTSTSQVAPFSLSSSTELAVPPPVSARAAAIARSAFSPVTPPSPSPARALASAAPPATPAATTATTAPPIKIFRIEITSVSPDATDRPLKPR